MSLSVALLPQSWRRPMKHGSAKCIDLGGTKVPLRAPGAPPWLRISTRSEAERSTTLGRSALPTVAQVREI